MSVLGLMENTADIGQTTPDLSALPSTNVDRMGAAWDAAQSPDRYWNVQGARKQRADKIIDDLHAQTGERLKNPYDNAPTMDEVRENLGQPTTVIYAKRLEKLRQATRNARAGMEQFGGLPQDYLDVDSIDASIAQESGARRARDERMTGTGGGLGGFLGSAGGEMLSPHGIMSSFIPVSRLPTAIVETTIAGFARNVAKEALFQGGTQGAAQALGTLVDYQTRKQFGTEQTNQQILEEILSAAGGGAILGGAFRATHLGILKLASRGVEIPPAVLDAARVQEGAELYGNKNPLRVEPAAHEAAQDQATGAAMAGRAASPDVNVGATPATTAAEAGAQALPPVPDGMVRMFHGGENATAGGSRDVAATFDYARNFGEGNKPVWYVDVPVDSPWLRQVDTTGTNMPRSFMNSVAPEDVMAGAKLVPGTEPGAPAAAAAAEAAPPVPAAEAEKAVADARLQGAAAAEPATPALTPEQQHKQAAAVEMAERYGLTEDIRTRLGKGETPEQISESLGGRLTEDEVAAVGDSLGVKAAAEGTPELDPVLQQLVKSVEGHPDNPMQAPRPAPPEVPAQPAKPKAPGESAEDKAVLQQAQQILDSETLTRIDPAAKSKMDQIDTEMQQAKAAVSCLAGAL